MLNVLEPRTHKKVDLTINLLLVQQLCPSFLLSFRKDVCKIACLLDQFHYLSRMLLAIPYIFKRLGQKPVHQKMLVDQEFKSQ